MYAMLVLYRAPEEPEAFEKRYVEGHWPLTDAWPRVGQKVFLKTAKAIQGDFPYAYVFRALWPNKEDWAADMGSDEMKAAVADVDEFAKGLYDIVTFEVLASS